MSTPDPKTVHMAAFTAEQMKFWHEVQTWDGKQQPNAKFVEQLKALTEHVINRNHLDHYNSNASDALRLPATRKELQRLEKDLTECQVSLTAAEEEVAAARNTANRYQQEIESLRTQGGLGGKKQDIAAPDKFTGDRKTYPAFKAQLQAKLAGDARKFESEQG